MGLNTMLGQIESLAKLVIRLKHESMSDLYEHWPAYILIAMNLIAQDSEELQ